MIKKNNLWNIEAKPAFKAFKQGKRLGGTKSRMFTINDGQLQQLNKAGKSVKLEFLRDFNHIKLQNIEDYHITMENS